MNDQQIYNKYMERNGTTGNEEIDRLINILLEDKTKIINMNSFMFRFFKRYMGDKKFSKMMYAAEIAWQMMGENHDIQRITQ